MNKQTFNYEKIMNEPIKVQQVTKTWYLRKPFEIRRGVSMVVIALTLFIIFRELIFFINSLMPGLMYVIYFGIPYFLTENLFKLKFEHKKPLVYLTDLLSYYLNIFLPKKKYCNDEATSLSKTIVFEEVKND
ncbi:TcpE family conjugal transfer membrane protein [Enterococcus sp. LJL128]